MTEQPWEMKLRAARERGDAVRILLKEFDAVDLPDAGAYARWVSCFEFALQRTIDCVPELVPLTTLDQLCATFANCEAQLRAFRVERNAGYFQNLVSSADVLATIATGLPFAPGAVAAGLESGLTAYVFLAEGKLAAFRERVAHFQQEAAGLTAKQAELVSTIESQKVRLDTAVNAFSDAQVERARLFSEALAAFAKAQTEAIAANDSQEIERSEERGDLFKKALSEMAGIHQAAMEASKAESTTLLSSLEVRAKVREQALLEEQQKAEKIVGAISEAAIASGYKVASKEESDAEKSWSRMAVVVWFAAICFGGCSLYVTPPNGTNWVSFVVMRLAVTLGAIGLAGYAAKRASDAKRNARSLLRMNLEIAAIKPFLANIPQEDRDMYRSITDRFFGQPDVDKSSSASESLANKATELAGKTIDTIGKVAEKMAR